MACSDAWFWSWTGSTTLAPTVEHEGSGILAGSGEQLREDRFEAEIIDEGKMVQTWDETTETTTLTTLIPTTQLENDWPSEKGTAEIPTLTSKPGNGSSSVEGTGSEGSDNFQLTGNVSRSGPELKSELASDNGSGLWSGTGLKSQAGIERGAETSWGLGVKTWGVSEENQPEGVLPTDHRGLQSGGGAVSQTHELYLKFQKSTWITSSRKDGDYDFGHKKFEQDADVFDNISKNTKHSHQNSTPGNLLIPVVGHNSVETTPVIKVNQLMEVTQLPVRESTATQEALYRLVSQTSQGSFIMQTLSSTQTPTYIHEIPLSQPQAANKKPDTTLMPIATEPQVLDSLSKTVQIASTSQMSNSLNAIQTSILEHEAQVSLVSQTVAESQTSIESHIEVAKSTLVVESPQCLLLDFDLPFCSSMVGERFSVPNHLNQSSVEDIQALLNEWQWLLKSHCHHSLEWFFCLLLVPKCGSMGPLQVLPCQSFCEVLRDSCWTFLDEGHLPVECHTLPDEEDDGYQCLSVSNLKGNRWFKRILVLGFILNHFSKPLLPSLSSVFNTSI